MNKINRSLEMHALAVLLLTLNSILTFGFLGDDDDALVVRRRGDSDGFRTDDPAAGEAVESRQVHGLLGEDLALRQSTLHHEGRSVADDHPMQIGRHVDLVFLFVTKKGKSFFFSTFLFLWQRQKESH